MREGRRELERLRAPLLSQQTEPSSHLSSLHYFFLKGLNFLSDNLVFLLPGD